MLPQKFEHLFDGTLGEFNMEIISLQLINPNCKPVHARDYTVLRSVEQQLNQSKKIVRLVDIGVHEDISLNGLLHLQQAFDKIKKVIGTKVLLCYPDFNKLVLFHLYTDTSDNQLGKSSCRIKSLYPFIRESSIQLKSDMKPLRESCYQLLKPARNTRISY
jgi:hypothetical protein